MKKSAALFVAAITAGFASGVLAHGGHGITAPSGIAHYLIEPLHLMQAFAPLAAIAITVWLLRHKTRKG